MVNSFNKRIQRFFGRSDFRKNPIEAILKRLLWRFHWTFSNRPYLISFAESLKISVPKSGSASLIYYQGFSELQTADFVMQFLKPGMTFVDVGAHIGEYTLLAAKLVGTSGKVHAFEPQTSLFPLLNKNIEINEIEHVNLNQSALSDRVGEIEFEIFDEPSVSSIRKPKTTTENGKDSKIVSVPTTSLDCYCDSLGQKVNLIKVDVEGAEKLVFEGAKSLMELPPSEAPTWIFEYAPTAYSMFNYRTQDLLDLLKQYGYQVYQYLGGGKIINFSPDKTYLGIINMITTKDKEGLISQLNQGHYN